MGRTKFKSEYEVSTSRSVSLSQREVDYNCQALNGSITHTFKFLCSLMDDAVKDGELNVGYIQAKLLKYRKENETSLKNKKNKQG